MKQLFISFNHKNGHGNWVKDVEDDFEISNHEDIRELEEEISMIGKISSVVILNLFILPVK